MSSRCRKSCSTLEAVLIALFIMMTLVALGLVIVVVLGIQEDSSGDTKPTASPSYNSYLIGVGRADCTGPLSDIPLMGYASPDQTAGGIHTRLYSRAFIIAEPESGKRVVFVSSDIGMVSQRLRLEVMQELKKRYGDLYGQDNVVLSGTHTHSGPGGYFQNTLFMVTSKGYIKPSIRAVVSGIVKSIDTAHENMKAGRIFINKGEVESSNMNRSPHSYLNNPLSERNRYKANTDKDIVVLKFVDMDGHGLGIISWFAVHPVSMNNTNHLVSSDNMGYASYLFEQEKNIGCLPGEGSFVAAFASTNLGDVSPNTKGPHCINTGESCENVNSKCPDGGNSMCIAMGPGNDMFESTEIIGQNIYNKAKELYQTASREVTGPIHFAHQWVNMTDVTVELNATHKAKTCKPSLGHSFAAGTIDGVGAFNFTQGSTDGDPFWDAIRDMLVGPPSNETANCQSPKPILFCTGELSNPVPWHPDIVDIQIFTIGNLAILAVPGEFTTMSGRRLREAVKTEFESHGTLGEMDVVIAGLSNVYTHYITTFEEYQVQRYEAASTIYGPHTLSAYIQSFKGLARAIAQNTVANLPKGPEPPFYNESLLFSLISDNPVDAKPANTSFGDTITDALQSYRTGEIVTVTFISANLRNSVQSRALKTFLTVEKLDDFMSTWTIKHNDASWETRLYWKKIGLAQSNVTVSWYIPHTAKPGTYRIQHFGHYKQRQGSSLIFTPYTATSSLFEIIK